AALPAAAGAALRGRDAAESADGGPQPAVAGAGRSGEVERHGDRVTDRVAVRVQDTGGEMIGVEVDAQQLPTAGPDLLRRGRHGGVRGPGGVQVPASPGRVEA